MKKSKLLLIILLCAFALFGISACGDTEEAPSAYDPVDIQVDSIDENGNVYSVLYDVSVDDKDQWSGYPEHENELETALAGIKACMDRDDWLPESVVYGYGGEAKLSNMMYSYGFDGTDGDYDSIKFYQLGIYNTTYQLAGELD